MIIKKTIRQSADLYRSDNEMRKFDENDDDGNPKILISNGVDYYDEDYEGDLYGEQYRHGRDEKANDGKDSDSERAEGVVKKSKLTDDEIFSLALQQLAKDNDDDLGDDVDEKVSQNSPKRGVYEL